MLYNLRTICFAGAAISFLILCIIALIGGIVIKYKKTLTNVSSLILYLLLFLLNLLFHLLLFASFVLYNQSLLM